MAPTGLIALRPRVLMIVMDEPRRLYRNVSVGSSQRLASSIPICGDGTKTRSAAHS